MNKALLKIKPVGGVGQIGSNMTLIQGANDTILIDAGILFPYEDFFDINYLIPNLEDIPTPSHLVITHGHEDHIGAIAHVVKKFPNIKVLASPFTAGLIRKKLEFNHTPYPITEYKHFEQLGFKDFTIDPIHVNHSIPETVGLLIKDVSEQLGFFFISDFKIDEKTIYERPFDFEKLIKLSKNLKKRILLCDSTNITSKTTQTPSEQDLIPIFDNLFKEAQNRIFITCFSSNIHRLMTFIALCKKHNKKLIPHGRSMISYLNTANELGMIPDYASVVKMAESVTGSSENHVILLSGCQGDFRGTFRRFCIGEDSQFKPQSTDTVLMSSKAIPGNEKKISMLINKLSEAGCKVVTGSDQLIHVSGHPGRDDLKRLYDNFKPTDIIPIHGESYFIREHIEFIKSTYPLATPHYILNNDEIVITNDLKLNILDGETIDPIIIHGRGIVLEKEKISERRKLACNGSVFLSLKLTSTRMKVEKFNFSLMGLPTIVTLNEERFKKFLDNYFIQINFKDIEKTNEELRVAIRKYFDQILGYKPITTIHIL
ncbi:MAG: ribonuclease J [Bacteriovoracaceae bacterium]|nr:ribonuclease J [Bacteriovoracaceae bacterium]